MSTLIDIPKMIDLAIGSPEPGVINFNILNSLLHIIVNHLNLNTHRVEFQGSQSNSIEYLLKNVPSESRNSFQIINRNSNESQNPETENINTIIVVQNKSEVSVEESNILDTTQSSSKNSIKSINIVSQDDFKNLSEKVEEIRDILAPVIPSSPITNDPNSVKTIFDLSERVSAIESGLMKITNIVTELMKEYSKCEKIMQQFRIDNSEVSSLKDKIDEIMKALLEHGQMNEQTISDINRNSIISIRKMHSNDRDTLTLDDLPTLTPMLDRLSSENIDVDLLRRQLNQVRSTQNQLINQLQKNGLISEPISNQTSSEPNSLPTSKTSIQPKAQDNMESECSQLPPKSAKQLEFIEIKLVSMDRIMDDIGAEMKDLKESMSCLNNRLIKAEEYVNQSENMDELQKIIENIDLNNKIVCELEHDRYKMLKLIEKHDEQIQEMILLKVDKDDVDMMLLEKADYITLKTKVSHDEFVACKQELENNLKTTLIQINSNEDTIKSMIEQISEILNTKISQTELNDIKNYFTQKYQSLQDRIKAIAALRRDPEAAGTQSKYLRNVHCISCSERAIMKRKESNDCLPKQACVPANPLLKPYLTYKLDKIRGELRDQSARNMKHYERLTKENERWKNTSNDLNKTHLCSRYCGGEHTKISVEDRFLKTRSGSKITSSYAQCNDYITTSNAKNLYQDGDQSNLIVVSQKIYNECENPSNEENALQSMDKTIDGQENLELKYDPKGSMVSIMTLKSYDQIPSSNDVIQIEEVLDIEDDGQMRFNNEQ